MELGSFEMKNEKCKIRNEKVIQFRIAGAVFALSLRLKLYFTFAVLRFTNSEARSFGYHCRPVR
jgi:hypothetical protein